MNKRAEADQEELKEWLQIVGNGLSQPLTRRKLKLPVKSDLILNSLEETIDYCFPPELFADPIHHAQEIADNALLCPMNVDVQGISEIALNRMAGIAKTYESIDTPITNGEEYGGYRADYNLEAIHLETPSGLPPHKLTLKVILVF